MTLSPIQRTRLSIAALFVVTVWLIVLVAQLPGWVAFPAGITVLIIAVWIGNELFEHMEKLTKAEEGCQTKLPRQPM